MVYSVKERDLMNILCFGDSNTWGYKPDKTGRFDEKTRWTGLLQQKLGPEYHIIDKDFVEERPSFRMNFVKTAADWIWLALRSRYIIRLIS